MFHHSFTAEYDGERIFKIDQHFAKLWAIISSFLLQNIVCKNIHSLKRNHHSSTAHAVRLANVSHNLKFLKVDLRETKVFGFWGKYGCSIVEVWLIPTQVSIAECQGHQREEVQVAQVMAK